ncbi:hypothetical protein ACGF5F_32720 [Streptomyces sp. NPDC047821]|uniref:hypothetical protein n=1 Tax=Streptomyces sp. NPDC047821 TaxID=3365488 RepID=UPI003722FDCF
MHHRHAAAAVLLLASLTACSGGDPDEAKPARSSSAASPSPAAAQDLAPTWTPKLNAAGEGAVAACQTPSSVDCSAAVDRIMAVVNDLEVAVGQTGRPYKETLSQIAKMRAAETEYTVRACKGDPAADDPNSKCHGVVHVTLGATTLTMTLATDDLS